eukprot:GHRQ01015703.1.p2 GENE.GHRQ01015703.1~~GHRQ01015703.1.p2  ORF type:complete len:126 (-),score=26.31 GHRQ01015703.1:948-1274(-)
MPLHCLKRHQLVGSTKPAVGAFWSVDTCCAAVLCACRQHTVLVNRGWVPPNWKAQWQERFAALQPTGTVSVTGVVQGSEHPSSFVPHNDAQAGDFFWMDVQGIVSCCL